MTDQQPDGDDKGALLRELRIDRSSDAPPAGRGRRTVVPVLAVCILLVALGAYLFFKGRPVQVRTVTAIAPAGFASGGDSVLQATGYVTARRQATVSTQITGTLKEVLIEEGERVQAGQVLARLEDAAQRAALAQAAAQVAAGQATLLQVRAQLQQARRDLERNQQLLSADAVSRQDAEQARTQVDALQAQSAAQQRQIDLAQAALDGARVQLAYTVVRAPFAGVIVAKAAQPGEIVSPISAGGGFTRTGVGTIVDMDSLEIDVDVNEAYINRVATNQKARAVLDAYPDWSIPAHVVATIPTADRSNATVRVRIGIDQKDPRILPDMGASVSFLEPAQHDATAGYQTGVLVPANAVLEREGQSIVFTIEGNHARAHAVHVGPAAGDMRRIDTISAGAVIVRQPPRELHDGAAVAVIKE